VEQVEFRQILDVGEAGRLFRIVSLLYHPRIADRRIDTADRRTDTADRRTDTDGRIDTDAVRTLALPALREQAAFLQLFATGAPPASGPP
jgi:hypothetical protein